MDHIGESSRPKGQKSQSGDFSRQQLDKLQEDLQQLENKFGSPPEPHRPKGGEALWRRFTPGRDVDPKATQSHDITKRIISNTSSIRSAFLDSSHPVAHGLSKDQLEQITLLVSLANDKYGAGFRGESGDTRGKKDIKGELEINRKIDECIQQWDKFLKGGAKQPTIDDALAPLLDQKRQSIEATTRRGRSLERSVLRDRDRSPEPSVLEMPSLRISCSAFVKIEDQGRYLLLLNKADLKRGKKVFSPIGGAIQMDDEGKGKQYIKRELGVEEEDFEKGDDLRFTMHGRGTNTLREWFLARKDRELTPFREIQEELGSKETGVLPDEELQGVQTTLLGFHSAFGPSRVGGALTQRFAEIHNVTGPPAFIEELKAAERRPDSPLRFVTTGEMEAGRTRDGIEIAAVCLALQTPTTTIREIF